MNSTTRTAYPRRGAAYAKQRRATGERHKFRFRRDLLPDPLTYYRELQGLTLKGSGEWRDTICPFHDDTSPSLRVNIRKGCFACMACQAKGGDVLAYHMKRHGLGFVEAAKALNAWEGQP